MSTSGGAGSAEQRVLEDLSYLFTRKRIKNINIRIRRDGSVAVSAPLRCPDARVESFLREKLPWVRAARRRAAAALPAVEAPCQVEPQAALALFTQVSAEIFPLFSAVLGGVQPTLKVRVMKTRWGVCKPAARQITLNLRLAEKPREAVEYVVLHEYAHFVRADHSAAFWRVVARFMPDYKARRELLK